MSSLNKVYCDRIQNIISTYDCVKACAVVKVPDESELFVSKVYIVLNNNYFPNEETKEYIKELFYTSVVVNGRTTQLKSYEIPSYIEFINELPRISGSEKIDYLFLEKDAADKVGADSKLILGKK